MTLASIFTSSHSKAKAKENNALAPHSSAPAPSHIDQESRPAKRLKLDSEPKAHPKASVSSSLASVAPLAERMRPQSLDDFVGHQGHVGPGTLLRGLIDSGTCGSLLLVRFNRALPPSNVAYLILNELSGALRVLVSYN